VLPLLLVHLTKITS
jgi:Ca2+-binding EF-hand superfamily protein